MKVEKDSNAKDKISLRKKDVMKNEKIKNMDEKHATLHARHLRVYQRYSYINAIPQRR